MKWYRCAKCSGKDIKQELTFMVNPNTYDEILDINNAWWEEDFYWCEDCNQEVIVEEIDDSEGDE